MIRIGIVGCGRILNAHLHGFRLLRDRGIDGFRITALVARREEDAWSFHTRGHGPPPRPPVLPPESGDPLAAPHTYLSDFQDDVQVRIHTDYRRMIDAAQVDAVIDTTPVYLHHQVGRAALEAGLHLLIQKPLAITVRAGRRLLDQARQRQRTLGVLENARYRPLVRAARWAFASGILGRPQLALLGSVGGMWSPDRIVADTPWRHDRLMAGGGGSLDIGVHQMDILRYVLGEVQSVQALARTFEPERVRRDTSGQVLQRQNADVDDTYFATVACEGGAIAQLLWSWASHGAPLVIPGVPAYFGSRGCVQGDQLLLDDGYRGPLLPFLEKHVDEKTRESLFPFGLRDSFAVLQLDWLRAIEAGRPGPETDGSEGLRDLAAAFAILESSRAGRAVTLDEVLNGALDACQREIDLHHGLVVAG
jgi:predicted dehydrogenase